MINIEPEYDLAYKINQNMGKEVHFSNGCTLDLEEREGVFEGVTPCGGKWSCLDNEYFMDTVINWLKQWKRDKV